MRKEVVFLVPGLNAILALRNNFFLDIFTVLNPSPVFSLVQQIWDADNECWKLSMNEMTEFNPALYFTLEGTEDWVQVEWWTKVIQRLRLGGWVRDEPVGSLRRGSSCPLRNTITNRYSPSHSNPQRREIKEFNWKSKTVTVCRWHNTTYEKP